MVTATATDTDLAPLTGEAMLTLLSWVSPACPIGAYTYSHGLEWAVEDGRVGDAAGLKAWIEASLAFGPASMDGVLLAEAWRAFDVGDGPALLAVLETAQALRPSAELFLETTSQGNAFWKLAGDVWGELEGMVWARTVLHEAGGPMPFPVAFALAAGAAGIALQPGLRGYFHAFASNLVSAGVRLIPLGQTDGQRVMRALGPVIEEAVRASGATSLEEAGSAALLIDWASMCHENQYTRLFRS